MRAIGIDLGTYNSAAAVALGRNRVAMIESKYGKTLSGKNFPSFVLFDHAGRKQLVGQRAREELRLNPKLVVWGVKRLVGLSYRQAAEQGELSRFAYDIEEGPGGSILIKVGDECFTPSHVLELILREIKEDAENASVNPLLGGRIDKAIISIPAYFKAIRTSPIIEAARHAGFDEVDTIAEPTAAAINYCVDVEREANLMAFDIGAGTLDVTVMMVVNERGELIPGELCTSGHEALGGIDMDDKLIRHLIDKYDMAGVRDDPARLAVLTEEVEKAKIRLSTRKSAFIDLPGDRTEELSRGELEEVLAPLLDRCRGPVGVSLRQAGLGPEDLDSILFIGGPSNMPCVRRMVRDELAKLGAKKSLLTQIDDMDKGGLPVDPMECVAKGASLKAGKIIEPIGKVISEGYGTIFGPVDGEDDFYEPIIKENSHYPISGTSLLCHGDPSALEVPIALVAKRPDTDKSTEEKTVYRYEYLGNYTLGITPQRRLPSVEIQLKVTDDKRVVASLIHTQTRQQVRYEGLDMLAGHDLPLQEHTPPKSWRMHDIDALNQTVTHREGTWTKDQLEHHLHVAREALALVREVSGEKLKTAVERLETAIERAVDRDGGGDPNEDCPNISNRTKELLDTLQQPGIRQIQPDEFRRYLEQLLRIAKMG